MCHLKILLIMNSIALIFIWYQKSGFLHVCRSTCPRCLTTWWCSRVTRARRQTCSTSRRWVLTNHKLLVKCLLEATGASEGWRAVDGDGWSGVQVEMQQVVGGGVGMKGFLG